MAISIFRSTDTSAPSISGTAGNLINVLDACLVNGYGAKSGLGQTKPFSGTNLAIYKMPTGTSGMYLAIDDTGTINARVRGFSYVSGVQATGTPPLNVGMHPFPNEQQYVGGDSVLKSTLATAAVRPQFLISDSTIFHLYIDEAGDGGSAGRIQSFGDVHSYVANDPNACFLMAHGASNYAYSSSLGNLATQSSHWFAQRYDGNGWSMPAGKYAISMIGGGSLAGLVMGMTGQFFMYPDPIDGGTFITPIGVVEQGINGNIPRGRVPGLWSPCHAQPYQNNDTVNGSGAMAGRTFEAFRIVQTASVYYGVLLFETSDTQRTTNYR